MMGQKPDRNGIRKEGEKRDLRQYFGGYIVLWVQRNGVVAEKECGEKRVFLLLFFKMGEIIGSLLHSYENIPV